MGLSSPKVNPMLKIFKLRWLPTKGKHLVLTKLSTFGCLWSNFHWFIATKHVGDSWFGSFQWSLGMWFVRQLSFTPPRGGCMPVFFIITQNDWFLFGKIKPIVQIPKPDPSPTWKFGFWPILMKASTQVQNKPSPLSTS